MNRLFPYLIWIAVAGVAFLVYESYSQGSASPATKPSSVSRASESPALPLVKHISVKGMRKRKHIMAELAQDSGSTYYRLDKGSRPLLNWTEVWNELSWRVRGYHRAATSTWLSSHLPPSWGINSYSAIQPSQGRQRDPSWV